MCNIWRLPSIDYDIKFIGGFKNVLFGGEGLFFTTLTSPGKVYLQTLPFSRLADRIIAASKFGMTGNTDEATGLAGLGGKVLGNLLSGK